MHLHEDELRVESGEEKACRSFSKLSVFDLDHTLLSENSSFLYCFYLFRKKKISLFSLFFSLFCYLRYRFLNLSITELHQAIFNRVLRGLSMDSLAGDVDAFLEKSLPSTLYAPALAKLKSAQHFGHYTVLLSSSPNFLVSAYARFFQVDEWRATYYAIDKDGRLCNISRVIQGEEKARAVEEIVQCFSLKKEDVTAYSDSYFDLSLLLSAGKPVAVNPDKKLLRLAQEGGWDIL